MLRRNTTAHGDSFQSIFIAFSVYFHSVNGLSYGMQRNWTAKPISHDLQKSESLPPASSLDTSALHAELGNETVLCS